MCLVLLLSAFYRPCPFVFFLVPTRAVHAATAAYDNFAQRAKLSQNLICDIFAAVIADIGLMAAVR